jgi:crotonobetainyl-CoA:carnitine CoA-transferase CaiB-like acyl-CoA transferase
MGYPWTRLRGLNPALVYCAMSGFGQTGPMSQAPAYDQIIQGLSGMMSVTGTPATAPLRVGFPIADTVGGLMAALSITAALTARARTGEGVFLDVSMLEASLSSMGWAVSNYLVSGVPPRPMGDQNATAAPSGTSEWSNAAVSQVRP